MKRMGPAAIGAVFSITAALGHMPAALAELKDGDRVAGVLIVVFSDGTVPEYEQDLKGRSTMGIPSLDVINAEFQLQSFRRQFPSVKSSVPPRSTHPLARYHVLRFHKDINLDEAAAVYRADPTIEHVEFDAYALMLAVPNDSLFAQMWSLQQPSDHDVDAELAWDVTTGSPSVVLGVTDTGVLWSHPDLRDNIWINPGEDLDGDGEVYDADDMNGVDDDGNGYVDDVIGWDFVVDGTEVGYDVWPGEDGWDQDNDPKDFHGHGTHVSGTIAAVTNNGIGVSGLSGGFGPGNPGGKIMCLRMGWSLDYFGNELGVTVMSYVAEAFVYGTDNGVRAINYSYGSSSGGGIEAATDYAVANDVVICAAAGNDNSQFVFGYLQSRADVITIAATDENDAKSWFSNYGSPVDIAAPGSHIWSTVSDHYTPGYASYSGTSMAAPHVVGLTGLMLSINPGLRRTDVLDIMQATADSTTDYIGQMGGGRINAHNAVQQSRLLRIGHAPLQDTKDQVSDFEVQAYIVSDTALDPDALYLRYIINTVETELILQPTGNPDEFHAFIPAQSAGTVIDYYLEAHDLKGDQYITPVYTFRVIDFDPWLLPANLWVADRALDTAWFDLTVINNGIFNDEFFLSLAGQTWATRVFDANGSTEIATTGVLVPDDSLNFKVRVEIPVSVFGDSDTVQVTATSVGDPIRFATSNVATMSTGVPLTIPFTEYFFETTVDTEKWLVAYGVEINDIGVNEPSPLYSANLNAHPYGRDTLGTLPIDLEGLGPTSLSYAYQNPSNEHLYWADLLVEYFNQSGSWEEIRRHQLDPSGMRDYDIATLTLPPDAYHPAFRVRFRTITGTYLDPDRDNWCVDNILIDNRPHLSVKPFQVNESYVSPDSSEVDLVVRNIGQDTLNFTTSLELPPGPEWLTMPTQSGSLQAGQGRTMTALIRTASLTQGVYTAQINLHSNDADPWDTLEVVPVTIVVTTCYCPGQGDFDDDGLVNIVDIARAIDYIFRSGPAPTHQFGCPADRGDVNNDGVDDVLDVVYIIDHAFRLGPPPVDPCIVP